MSRRDLWCIMLGVVIGPPVMLLLMWCSVVLLSVVE